MVAVNHASDLLPPLPHDLPWRHLRPSNLQRPRHAPLTGSRKRQLTLAAHCKQYRAEHSRSAGFSKLIANRMTPPRFLQTCNCVPSSGNKRDVARYRCCNCCNHEIPSHQLFSIGAVAQSPFLHALRRTPRPCIGGGEARNCKESRRLPSIPLAEWVRRRSANAYNRAMQNLRCGTQTLGSGSEEFSSSVCRA
jgi:hypothetical protein